MDAKSRNRTGPEITRDYVVARRDELLKELGTLDAEVVMHFGRRGATAGGKEGWFSDWPDSFNNNGTWYKTWGKAGVDELNPALGPRVFSFGRLLRLVLGKLGLPLGAKS